MSEHEAPAVLPPPPVPPHAIIPEKRPARPPKDDRRKEPRYPARHGQANLGWYRDESYLTLPGRLEDVSSGGASLVLEGAAWEGGDVWVCLTGGVRTEWVRAEVVGASQVEGGTQRVRLRFHESCPFDFFKTAAWGNPASPAPSPHPHPQPEPAPDSRADLKEDARGPHVPCTAPEEAPDLDLRELRVSVTMCQPPRLGRSLDDERDDRVVLVPKAYLAVLQLVAALLVAGIIVIKVAGLWRLDTLLGLGEPRP